MTALIVTFLITALIGMTLTCPMPQVEYVRVAGKKGMS